MNEMIRPRREVFAKHSFVVDGPITGRYQNAGAIVVRVVMQRVLAKRTARCKKGS